MNFYQLYNEIAIGSHGSGVQKPPPTHLSALLKYTYGALPKYSEDRASQRFADMKRAAGELAAMDMENTPLEEIISKLEEIQVEGNGYVRLAVVKKHTHQ